MSESHASSSSTLSTSLPTTDSTVVMKARLDLVVAEPTASRTSLMATLRVLPGLAALYCRSSFTYSRLPVLLISSILSGELALQMQPALPRVSLVHANEKQHSFSDLVLPPPAGAPTFAV